MLITRRGQAVACLVPAVPALGSARAQETADRLMSLQVGHSLQGLVLADLIAEGRR